MGSGLTAAADHRCRGAARRGRRACLSIGSCSGDGIPASDCPAEAPGAPGGASGDAVWARNAPEGLRTRKTAILARAAEKSGPERPLTASAGGGEGLGYPRKCRRPQPRPIRRLAPEQLGDGRGDQGREAEAHQLALDIEIGAQRVKSGLEAGDEVGGGHVLQLLDQSIGLVLDSRCSPRSSSQLRRVLRQPSQRDPASRSSDTPGFRAILGKPASIRSNLDKLGHGPKRLVWAVIGPGAGRRSFALPPVRPRAAARPGTGANTPRNPRGR